MQVMFQSVTFCLIALISVTFASIPNRGPINKKRSAGRYIVTLRNRTKVDEFMKRHAKRLPKSCVKHTFGTVHNGFAAELNKTELDFFKSSDDVLRVSPDTVMTITSSVTQKGATWGLGRISQNNKVKPTGAYTYNYDCTGGKGVNIYVIDTGINVNHVEFGERASLGPCYVDNNCISIDDNGHGTHCAGTAAGITYGVAKNANIYGLKVLDSDGSGYTSSVIEAIDYVASLTNASSKNVISMSLGGDLEINLNNAVENAIRHGVTVVCAAGNGVPYNETVGTPLNACDNSPSSAPNAITVAAIDKTDTRAQWSNCGKCIDIFGPGIGVTSSWIGSTTAINTISGTSMATPHVAGMAAYIIAKYGTMKYGAMTPAQVMAKMREMANCGAVSIGSCPTSFGTTANYLLRNDQMKR